MLLTITAKEKALFADYLHLYGGIAGFRDQRITFTRVKSRDFNLRVERARKFLFREALIAKTDLVTLLFPPGIYGTRLLLLMLLTITAKGETLFADYLYLFAWNCGL